MAVRVRWNQKGAVKIFARSEIERNLRYTEYLGDGDSSSFLQVKSSQSYGDKLITKSKCIGHIQKRVGTRYKRKKLSNGKPLTGKNRLTQKIIDTLQHYHGVAIRNNTDSLQVDMVNAVPICQIDLPLTFRVKIQLAP